MKMRVVLLSNLFMFGLMSSFCSYAGEWRQLEGASWQYIDNSGNVVYDDWKQGADGTWYFLGSDGLMLTNTLVEDDGEYYYLDETGSMVQNAWFKLCERYENSYHWYYFGADGKAYRQKSSNKLNFKEINDKTYLFDTEGHMLTGWITEDGEALDVEDEEGWKDAVYYAGGEDEGWLATDFHSISVYDEDDEDYKTYNFYFKSNHKKAVDTVLTITEASGNRYKCKFNEYGRMVLKVSLNKASSNSSNTTSSSSSNKKNNSSSTTSATSKSKAHWYQTIPASNQNEDDYNSGTKRYRYADSKGNTVYNQIKKIEGKYYLFDKYGYRREGLIALYSDDTYAFTLHCLTDVDDFDCSAEDVIAAREAGYKIMYFDTSTGARKTGNVSIELEDDKYKFKFKSSGEAITGISENHLYDAGILIKADKDDENKRRTYTLDGVEYVVDTSGRIVK